jgi:hypothetical protein
MAKRLLVCMVALAGLTYNAQAGQNNVTTQGPWSGIIINSSCTQEQAFAEADECVKPSPGGSLSFYDDTTRQIFTLDTQGPAIGHLGDAVTVRGTLEGNTLHLASLELLSSIGLPVGQKAPNFSARDQFGHVQTLDTLRGRNGTVLLIFRSADW